MWVIVYFDLPTDTKDDRKLYTVFRKNLMKSGFTMFQFSIYIRHCMSREYADKFVSGVKKILPAKGHVVISTLTDKQFSKMEVYHGKEDKKSQPGTPMILEFF